MLLQLHALKAHLSPRRADPPPPPSPQLHDKSATKLNLSTAPHIVGVMTKSIGPANLITLKPPRTVLSAAHSFAARPVRYSIHMAREGRGEGADQPMRLEPLKGLFRWLRRRPHAGTQRRATRWGRSEGGRGAREGGVEGRRRLQQRSVAELISGCNLPASPSPAPSLGGRGVGRPF